MSSYVHGNQIGPHYYRYRCLEPTLSPSSQSCRIVCLRRVVILCRCRQRRPDLTSSAEASTTLNIHAAAAAETACTTDSETQWRHQEKPCVEWETQGGVITAPLPYSQLHGNLQMAAAVDKPRRHVYDTGSVREGGRTGQGLSATNGLCVCDLIKNPAINPPLSRRTSRSTTNSKEIPEAYKSLCTLKR